ncbi:MAG: proline racemase family protein [Deltaproteobacteria bacterium]|nr:proline racemase family protein [Deltaproteobacteria bacterium]MBW2635014.1 proline racemase family protein [Deltaproteobacteria bacterium]
MVTIDSHTAGEPTRLIVGGIDSVPGKTMREKRIYFMEHYDHIRKQLTWETRGHRGMFAAFLTKPVTEGAHFGLIYMDSRRYPYLCGHGTMGAVMTLIEAGFLPVTGEEMSVVVDTPSGPMETVAYIKNDRVESIAIRMVPSFVYQDQAKLELPDIGAIQASTVCVGGFFVMVSSEQLGLDLNPANSPRLIELGMNLIDAANQQLKVRHPTRAEVNTVDVTEFYDPATDAQGMGKSVVVYGERHMDRSPCGTGTAAKMTLLHHQGKINPGDTFTNTSPLGTTFQGRIVEELHLGDTPAVVAEIRGGAYVTGIHEFIVDPRDPFQEGYLI